jgi:hypothetical protein
MAIYMRADPLLVLAVLRYADPCVKSLRDADGAALLKMLHVEHFGHNTLLVMITLEVIHRLGMVVLVSC